MGCGSLDLDPLDDGMGVSNRQAAFRGEHPTKGVNAASTAQGDRRSAAPGQPSSSEAVPLRLPYRNVALLVPFPGTACIGTNDVTWLEAERPLPDEGSRSGYHPSRTFVLSSHMSENDRISYGL